MVFLRAKTIEPPVLFCTLDSKEPQWTVRSTPPLSPLVGPPSAHGPKSPFPLEGLKPLASPPPSPLLLTRVLPPTFPPKRDAATAARRRRRRRRRSPSLPLSPPHARPWRPGRARRPPRRTSTRRCGSCTGRTSTRSTTSSTRGSTRCFSPSAPWRSPSPTPPPPSEISFLLFFFLPFARRLQFSGPVFCVLVRIYQFFPTQHPKFNSYVLRIYLKTALVLSELSWQVVNKANTQ